MASHLYPTEQTWGLWGCVVSDYSFEWVLLSVNASIGSLKILKLGGKIK